VTALTCESDIGASLPMLARPRNRGEVCMGQGAAERACTSLVRAEPGRILAIAAFLAALLFGLAGLVGALGYVISVTRCGGPPGEAS